MTAPWDDIAFIIQQHEDGRRLPVALMSLPRSCAVKKITVAAVAKWLNRRMALRPLAKRV
jgi:hypothetical protein